MQTAGKPVLYGRSYQHDYNRAVCVQDVGHAVCTSMPCWRWQTQTTCHWKHPPALRDTELKAVYYITIDMKTNCWCPETTHHQSNWTIGVTRVQSRSCDYFKNGQFTGIIHNVCSNYWRYGISVGLWNCYDPSPQSFVSNGDASLSLILIRVLTPRSRVLEKTDSTFSCSGNSVFYGTKGFTTVLTRTGHRSLSWAR
jgi:hypothetical protein